MSPSETTEDSGSISFDRDEFGRFSDEFAKAELAIKFSERISGDTSLPAVNQLRYAARHIAEGDVDKAVQHCRRSKYDAYEAAIIFLLKFYAEFNARHYPCETLDRYLPSWREYRERFLVIRAELVRMHPLREFSESDFSRLQEWLDSLGEIRDFIERVYPEIDSELARIEEEDRVRRERERQDREDAKAREDRRRYVLSLWWTICGTLLGALGILLTFFR